MKQKLITLRERSNRLAAQGTVIVAAGLGSSAAFAELPAGATTAISQIQTDGLALIDAYWPVVTALTVGFILIKLFKKGANKAT